jgi:hypothetical protein
MYVGSHACDDAAERGEVLLGQASRFVELAKQEPFPDRIVTAHARPHPVLHQAYTSPG